MQLIVGFMSLTNNIRKPVTSWWVHEGFMIEVDVR